MMGRLVGGQDRLFYAFELDAVVPGIAWCVGSMGFLI